MLAQVAIAKNLIR